MFRLGGGRKPAKSAKPIDRIVLHIGQEKCGSKSIQWGLETNKSALAAHGISTPGTPKAGHYDMGLHAYAGDPQYFNAFRDIQKIDSPSIELFQSDFRKRLLAEAPTLNASTLVLSFEGLVHLSRAGIKRLTDLLYELTSQLDVFCVVRRQDRVATSSYTTRLVNSGYTATSLLYHAQGHPAALDSFKHLENWAKYVGRENMHVIAYEDHDNVVLPFLEFLGVPADEVKLPPRLNSALSARSQEIIRQFNQAYASRPEWQPLVPSVRDTMRHSLPGGIPRLPSQADVDTFLKRFERSNQKLMDRYLSKDSQFNKHDEPLPEADHIPDVSLEEVNEWVSKALTKTGQAWPSR